MKTKPKPRYRVGQVVIRKETGRPFKIAAIHDGEHGWLLLNDDDCGSREQNYRLLNKKEKQ